MRCRAVTIAGTAVAIALGGCGGGGPSASSTSPATAATGLAAQPAARILADAEAAIDRVHSFHVQTTATTAATGPVSESLEVVLPGKLSIVIRLGAREIDLRAVDGGTYYRANRPYLAAEGVTGSSLDTSGRWISASATQVPTLAVLLALTRPATLGRCLLGQNLGTLSVGGTATVGGARAVVLNSAGDRPGSVPGKLYVAAAGPPLPLRLTRSGKARAGGTADAACGQSTPASGGTSDTLISGFNAPVTISAPAGAIPLSSLTSPKPATGGVAAAAVQTARTRLGTVGYREVGAGPPLVLIMGYGGTMETWQPSFIDALAKHHRVVIFDNAGIGATAALPAPLSIDEMADQTSALIDTLGLHHADVLGWSMGGMIAQALAVRHPTAVARLVLCATFPGAGTIVRPAQAAIDALSSPNPQKALADLFPPGESAAQAAFVAGTATYPSAPSVSAATLASQGRAVTRWWSGKDAAGRLDATIAVPTLVADGTVDRLDPVANSPALAHLIRGAKLVLYPGAGHAFLFAQAAFLPLLESFLG